MMERLKDRRRAMQDTQESTGTDLDNTTRSSLRDPNNTWVTLSAVMLHSPVCLAAA